MAALRLQHGVYSKCRHRVITNTRKDHAVHVPRRRMSRSDGSFEMSVFFQRLQYAKFRETGRESRDADHSLRNPRANVDVFPITAEDTEVWTTTVIAGVRRG